MSIFDFDFDFVCSASVVDNIELILKSVGSCHGDDPHDNDQPDYDSVASDEDVDLDANSGKTDRTKVTLDTKQHLKNLLVTEPGLVFEGLQSVCLRFVEMMSILVDQILI